MVQPTAAVLLLGCWLFAFAAAAYPEVKPVGIKGERAFHPKRFKGNGLNTDKHLSGHSDQTKIVELTEATFDAAVRDFKALFVAFVMHDTGQVDGLLIEWGRLALDQVAQTAKKEMLIAKVDAVKYPELAAKYRVEHYLAVSLLPVLAREQLMGR